MLIWFPGEIVEISSILNVDSGPHDTTTQVNITVNNNEDDDDDSFLLSGLR